jgi:hypothetical protein
MASTIKVDNVQNQPGTNVINKCGTTITLGASGDTVSLASGASQSGFGRTGTVDWDTSTIKTSTFTPSDGNGYFCNTSGGAFTVNLPAGSAGAIVAFADYTRTFGTNKLTIEPNGSEKIGGVADGAELTTDGETATFIYVDATEGWININQSETTQTGLPPYITATGGTVTTSGNCKIHTFTGPGTFTVNNLAQTPANNALAYLVIAGGGAGGDAGNRGAGGGGAGGFREGRNNPITPYTASPLAAACSALTASVTSYPITVGAGGVGRCSPNLGVNGSNSIFSTITSAGGGGGGGESGCSSVTNGTAGGSGGGAGRGGASGSGGSGNTPPTTPPQGNDGGASGGAANPSAIGGGGGGATASGGPGQPGGAGGTTCISGSPVARGGGGGAGAGCGETQSCGGAGGGGNGGSYPSPAATAGTVNTGGGGGGSADNSGGKSGGSGIVIIRYKYQ